MIDSITRGGTSETTESEVLPQPKAGVVGTSEVEVPYLNYKQAHTHPYLVEHFGLGDTWNDPSGGFPKEVSALEDYFANQITSGEIPNTVSAVKEQIKKMEKMNNIPKEERTLVRVETLAAYVEFLMKADSVKRNIRRYGTEY